MTSERLEVIKTLKEHEKCPDDVLLFKEKILKLLLNDLDIIETLHNVELENKQALPEDYHNVNIYSYLKIPDTQSTVKNYVCFDVNDIEENYYNNAMVTKQVIFRCVSHEKDVETIYGIDRQDLLGYLIKDNFQWNNQFGVQWKKNYDGGRIAENGYYYREIHFKVTNLNGLQRGLTTNVRNRI